MALLLKGSPVTGTLTVDRLRSVGGVASPLTIPVDVIDTGSVRAQGGTFPGVGTSTAQIIAGTDYAALSLIDAQQPVDGRFWNVAISGTAFGVLTVNDADTVSKTAMQATRTANVVTAVSLGNSTDKPPITLNGAVIIPTPASGAALTVNSLPGLGISVVTPAGAANQINLAQTGQHTVSLYQAASDNAFRIFINGFDRLVLGDSGSLQSYGPVAGLTDMTPDNGAGAIQCTSGMTTTPSGTATFRRFGKMAFLEVPAITGTGNTVNTLTFTLAYPSGFAPTTSRSSSVSLANAGSGVTGQLFLSSTGFTVVISPVVGTNFTGTCGFNVPIIVPYAID